MIYGPVDGYESNSSLFKWDGFDAVDLILSHGWIGPMVYSNRLCHLTRILVGQGGLPFRQLILIYPKDVSRRVKKNDYFADWQSWL